MHLSHTKTDSRRGINHGHATTPIPKTARPSNRKGIQSTRTKFVRSVVREVAGFAPYERRVMELLRNSKVRHTWSGHWHRGFELNRAIGQEGAQVDEEAGSCTV
jgi:large subunit ribosomal protein L36e